MSSNKAVFDVTAFGVSWRRSPKMRSEKSRKFSETSAEERERGGRSAAVSLKRSHPPTYRVRIVSLVVSGIPRATSVERPSGARSRASVEVDFFQRKRIFSSSPPKPEPRRFLRRRAASRRRNLRGGGVAVRVPGDVQERLAALPARRPRSERRLFRSAKKFRFGRSADVQRGRREAHCFFRRARFSRVAAFSSRGFGNRRCARSFRDRRPVAVAVEAVTGT